MSGTWVDVANDLLSKCHIDRCIKKLSECDGLMFVALYEAILGERVPDFIPVSRNQEDDAHNIQAVIDSLALDYLQVSLSHITGENIVKGDKESIKNLLEIFDGLLEYLTEQISEASSRIGDDVKPFSKDGAQKSQLEEPQHLSIKSVPASGPSAVVRSSVPSSEICTASSDVEGSESTAELIRLGDTAHSFLLRKSVPELDNGGELQREKHPNTTWTKEPRDIQTSHELPGQVHFRRDVTERKGGLGDQVLSQKFPSDSLRCSAKKLGEPIRPAIPLQPPYHPLESRPSPQPGGKTEHRSSDGAQLSLTSCQGTEKPAAIPGFTESLRPMPETRPTNAHQFTSCKDDLPAGNERPGSKENRNILPEEQPGPSNVTESSSASALKKVAFRSLPDVKFLTLQSNAGEKDEWESISEEEDMTSQEEPAAWRLPKTTHCTAQSDNAASSREWEEDITALFTDEPLSCRRAKYLLSEQELQEKSEKLSQRLQELDLMLKRALGAPTQVDESRDEDKLSQHSDSFMEYRRKRHQPAVPHQKSRQSRARSLSFSPPPPPLPWCGHDAQFKDQMGKIHRELQKDQDQQRIKKQVVNRDYDELLKSYGDTERIRLSEMKTKLQETEKEFKESIFKEPAKPSGLGKVYSKRAIPRKARDGQRIPSRSVARPRKATPIKIKDNDLLPLLLEEFPYLHISPHTLNQMWKQQFAQMEQLTKSASEEDRSRVKLINEVEVAQKQHDLLVEILRKEEGHNQRLQEFKERIRHQKSTQNKIRERRQQTVRAKKYYEGYHVQLRAKMLRARSREERMFKNLFEEGLEIQKQRLREVRNYAKEKREAQKKQFEDELQSMENYYKDQFSMLAEAVSQERKEIQTREKAQTKTLQKLRRQLRAKMENEIRELQDLISKSNDDTFYFELEAEQLKRKVRMASFYHSKTHLP
ncbi:centrosomal protein of 95 kDa isoform X2 [Rhinatrema bivittatum]|uniref:centrosomal protein of 95 kDa isoform X2 n=1 Tax=Rhinatrema bivittatum TaxID=194408 RepID=UPI00112CF6F1|nr:centrosomal protein of 95 kDa isoform X2 [Rhinatrema bivittatum]